MNNQRFNAYEDLIERQGKATLSQLIKWTASNKFMTKKYLSEIMDLGLIIKKGNYYYLDEQNITKWEELL